MPHNRKTRISLALALTLALLISLAATTAVFAHANTAASTTPHTLSATKASAPQILYSHTVDMSKVPQATPEQLQQQARSLPYLTPKGAAAHQQAQHSNSGAAAPHGAGLTPITSGTHTAAADLPSTFNKFQGQSNSAATCPYFGGCQPPDMGLAASPAGQVLQSVNTSLALYNVVGTLQPGWPKTAQAFFGVPNPLPANCDTHGPFMSDPRAWYDPFANRWGEAMLQVENAFGVGAGCNFQTLYWVATSMTPNPNGVWRVFALNMAFGSDATGAADFTQFGFNGDGIYVSANMFNQAGTAYDYAEVVGCGKKAIYGGVGFGCGAWFNFTDNGVKIDTLNPVQTPMSADNAPHTEFFVSSFNSPDPFGHDCVTAACHGATIWSLSDPGNTTGVGNVINGVFVDTNIYVEPPAAHQPSCPSSGGSGCVDGGDNRIGATPVYHAGHIFAAHVTGFINASSQLVPAIQWWDFTPSLATGYPTHLTGATEAQDNYLAASSGFTALTYPVIYPDIDNDFILGYDYMGDSIFPSINYTSRRVTDTPNVMTGGLGIIAVGGTMSTPNTRWGDFEAMSYTAPYQDFIWFASQYPNPAIGGQWGTYIMRLQLTMRG